MAKPLMDGRPIQVFGILKTAALWERLLLVNKYNPIHF
jgi:hypothetical protein